MFPDTLFFSRFLLLPQTNGTTSLANATVAAVSPNLWKAWSREVSAIEMAPETNFVDNPSRKTAYNVSSNWVYLSNKEEKNYINELKQNL